MRAGFIDIICLHSEGVKLDNMWLFFTIRRILFTSPQKYFKVLDWEQIVHNMIKHLKGRSKLGFRDYVSNKIFWRAAKCQQIFAWFLAARDHTTNLVSEPMTIHCPLSNYLWKKHVFCRPYTVVKPNICTYLNILEGEKIFILHTI